MWSDPRPGPRERLLVAALLLATFALRAWRADQPIVENYVGRQVPTAMVARNLERGSGWLRPRLQTGPFPNLFVVEPPLFAGLAVAFRRMTGLPLTDAGRLASALFTTLGAWGLHGLARRREGATVAAFAVAAFAVLPITIRYGRAFQPDMAMLGTQLAALRCWDEADRRPLWLVAGWPLLATSLALKITSAYVLIPLLWTIVPPRRWARPGLALLALAPALLWYGHAARLLGEAGGSRATAESAAIWLGAIGQAGAIGRLPSFAWRFLVLRAFTPIGFALGAWGWLGRGDVDGLWKSWAVAAGGALVLLAAKAHHEYYWLTLAPLAAVGIGRAIAGLPRAAAIVAWVAFVALALVQVRSTWQTPPEWSHLEEAAGIVGENVPGDALVVAPEALLFEADRRGARLEFGREAAARAAREWGGTLDPAEPLALVEFYRGRGARYLVVLDSEDAWRDRVRARYEVLVDRPGVLLARLGGATDGDD